MGVRLFRNSPALLVAPILGAAARLRDADRLPPEAYMRAGRRRRRAQENPPKMYEILYGRSHEAQRHDPDGPVMDHVTIEFPNDEKALEAGYLGVVASGYRYANVYRLFRRPYPRDRKLVGSIGVDGKVVRENPPLILVTGNPPASRADAERRWCEFHQRDAFDGSVRNLRVQGTPPILFGIGTVVAIDLGDGDQSFGGGAPLLGCNPGDSGLWIISPSNAMNLSAVNGATVHAVTYKPHRETGSDKRGNLWRHDFSAPRPKIAPVGAAKACKAAFLEGGGYDVRDWLYD